MLPVLFYLQTYSVNRLIRLGFPRLLPGGAGYLGGGSRAGFIAVSVVASGWCSPSRRKGLALALVVAAVVGFLALRPKTSPAACPPSKSRRSLFMGRVIRKISLGYRPG